MILRKSAVFRVPEPQNTKDSIGSRAVQRGGAEIVKKLKFMAFHKFHHFSEKAELSPKS